MENLIAALHIFDKYDAPTEKKYGHGQFVFFVFVEPSGVSSCDREQLGGLGFSVSDDGSRFECAQYWIW